MSNPLHWLTPPDEPDAVCKIKRLGAEIYVTNKASATPHRNYAPQSWLKYSICAPKPAHFL
jgi:hypothetical protein